MWRAGQDRRLAIIERYVSLDGRRVLDLGCGLGQYVRAAERHGAIGFGCDIEPPRLKEARAAGTERLVAAAGEYLPFADGSFDVVILNEVIEHVDHDAATMREVGRVLAPGGTAVIYAPNRLYPFETHGIMWRGRYIEGNIPLVNWLPGRIRDRLVPHARAYLAGDWEPMIRGSGLRTVDRGYVYPGFDNVAARWPRLATAVRRFCYWAEDNALARFGLSHLVVLERVDHAAAAEPGQ